jgi:hypothetical protein
MLDQLTRVAKKLPAGHLFHPAIKYCVGTIVQLGMPLIRQRESGHCMHLKPPAVWTGNPAKRGTVILRNLLSNYSKETGSEARGIKCLSWSVRERGNP